MLVIRNYGNGVFICDLAFLHVVRGKKYISSLAYPSSLSFCSVFYNVQTYSTRGSAPLYTNLTISLRSILVL